MFEKINRSHGILVSADIRIDERYCWLIIISNDVPVVQDILEFIVIVRVGRYFQLTSLTFQNSRRVYTLTAHIT